MGGILTMRMDKDLKLILAHPEWYTTKKGVGYIPTEEAPKEAVEAMERVNENQRRDPEYYF